MQKGENLILNDLTFDPSGLAFIEFGKDSDGRPATRQHFKEIAETKEWRNVPAKDFALFIDFAKVNELYREAQEVI